MGPVRCALLLLFACHGRGADEPVDTTDSGGTQSLDCDGVEVPWPAEQRAREAEVFDRVNAQRTAGIEAGSTLCDGVYFPAVEPARWHDGVARNLQCALSHDRAAHKQWSDWEPTDLAAGTDLQVTTSFFEDCSYGVPAVGCIWAEPSFREDPLSDWFNHPDQCWFPMQSRYAVGAVGVSAWGEGESWYLVLAYPANQ